MSQVAELADVQLRHRRPHRQSPRICVSAIAGFYTYSILKGITQCVTSLRVLVRMVNTANCVAAANPYRS